MHLDLEVRNRHVDKGIARLCLERELRRRSRLNGDRAAHTVEARRHVRRLHGELSGGMQRHTFSVTLHSAGQFTVKATDVPSGFYGVSGTITVQPGPPAKLAFQTQSGDTFVDVTIADFKVEVHDADDNLVDSSNAEVKIAVGNNPTGVAV